jgi:hypothetical protein
MPALAVWFPRRLAGLVAVAAGLLVLSPASVPAAPGGATVFVHTAKGGEVKGGRLILQGVGPRLTWVTNGGRTGAVSVARLHRRLFPKQSPAATGVLHVGSRRRGVALRLSRPRYRPSSKQVSYRARALKSGQAGTPRRFGAASLSILGDPAVQGGVNGGHNCSVTLLNHALYNLGVVSASKLQTDIWSPEIRPGDGAEASDGIASWQSDGGPLLGCSNSVVWQFQANSVQPSVPVGTFTITTSYPWTGPFSNTCTSTVPQHTCRAWINKAGQVGWEIRPG